MNDEAIDELIPTDDQKVKRRDAETHEQERYEMLRSDCVENESRTTSEVSLTTRSDTKESKSDEEWTLPQVKHSRKTKQKQLPNSQGIEPDIQRTAKHEKPTHGEHGTMGSTKTALQTKGNNTACKIC